MWLAGVAAAAMFCSLLKPERSAPVRQLMSTLTLICRCKLHLKEVSNQMAHAEQTQNGMCRVVHIAVSKQNAGTVR